MEDVLTACTVTMNIPVAWGEMDAMGHVNNIIYFRYFETVRIEYFNRLNMMGYQNQWGIGPILASTECRFKMPLQYPDTVIAGTKILSMEEDRFVMSSEEPLVQAFQRGRSSNRVTTSCRRLLLWRRK